jgi:hypothetical protein
MSNLQLSRRRFIGGATVLVGFAGVQSALGAPAECIQHKPFVVRNGFIDVGVPVDPDGDPGSGSFGSPPFGATNELGIIFDALDSFSMSMGSIAMGVVGNAATSLTAYELAPGTTTRVGMLARSAVNVAGVAPFNLYNRIYGVQVNTKAIRDRYTWYWFDVPLTLTFVAGKRYELVFSDFALTGGVPVMDASNWLYVQLLYDFAENRAYGQPYDVCGLMRVVDGSLRGTRATGLPMMLLSVNRPTT